MHKWVEHLLALQDKDIRIRQLVEQIETVPVEIARAKAEQGKAEEIAADAKAALQACQMAIKDTEINIEAVMTKMRDFQTKSSMIKSNTEYRAAMDQIETCKKQIGQHEDRQLELMEDLETCKQALAAKQKEVDAVHARGDEQIADLQTRERNCKVQLEKFLAQRSELGSAVPKTILNRYNRLRKSGALKATGRVLVPVRDSICGNCHMNVPAQIRVNAQKGQMASCQMCNALLYVED